ncbi:unnamed protein product [Umbelopsis vinacea]
MASAVTFLKFFGNRIFVSFATNSAQIRWASIYMILANLPTVSAGCLGLNDLSQAAGAILSQIGGQTLLLSTGSTLGGSQSFATDHYMAFGLLSVGVAGINGIHASSTILSNERECQIGMSDDEREDREGNSGRYASLIARLLRLFSTAIISIVVGIFTYPMVSLGWTVVLLLTIALIAYGETYAPLGVVIYNSDIFLWQRYREDGSTAREWRYTLTPSGSFIMHNDTLQSKVIFGRAIPSMNTDSFNFELERWSGTYLAASLSVVTWLWWLISLQLLAPWTWAPIVISTTGVSMLMLAEWCNSLDSGDYSYGYSLRARFARAKLQEHFCMYEASGVKDLMQAEEELWLMKMVSASLVVSQDLSAVKLKNRLVRSVDCPTVIGSKFAELYTLGSRVSATLQHEKDRLEVNGNTWPHLRVVEWAIAWNIELGKHAISCNMYQSELKGYHHTNLVPTSATLRACTAISHKSCDVVSRFRKEVTAVWHGQLWKFAALAQICTSSHPELARRAANCHPDNHVAAIKLWSEYLFDDQGWDPCIVLLNMIKCLSDKGAITYSAYNALTVGIDTYIGCRSEFSHEKAILWYGNKIVQLNRDIPTPLAAPPRFARKGSLLPIAESAIVAERKILPYLRISAPRLLNMHAAHALLDLPSNGENVWDENADGEWTNKNDHHSTEARRNE